MAVWPWQLQPRSRCQSTRHTRFTQTRLVWNVVLWNDFSLKFCTLKWFQSEILCYEMISVWNFVLWNDFSLKFCALKWFQSEILCSEMISAWNFVLWNEFSLKFCTLKFYALNWNFFVPLGHRIIVLLEHKLKMIQACIVCVNLFSATIKEFMYLI